MPFLMRRWRRDFLCWRHRFAASAWAELGGLAFLAALGARESAPAATEARPLGCWRRAIARTRLGVLHGIRCAASSGGPSSRRFFEGALLCRTSASSTRAEKSAETCAHRPSQAVRSTGEFQVSLVGPEEVHGRLVLEGHRDRRLAAREEQFPRTLRPRRHPQATSSWPSRPSRVPAVREQSEWRSTCGRASASLPAERMDAAEAEPCSAGAELHDAPAESSDLLRGGTSVAREEHGLRRGL